MSGHGDVLIQLQCRVAVEVRKKKSGNMRVLAIVSPSEGKAQSESVLMIFKTKMFSNNLQVDSYSSVCMCISMVLCICT